MGEVVAIVEQIARLKTYVADCWVMASCSLVRRYVWEEHTPLYSRHKHRCFERKACVCLTERHRHNIQGEVLPWTRRQNGPPKHPCTPCRHAASQWYIWLLYRWRRRT